jgi:hypothetical protein
MPAAGLEPVVPVSERLQTHALDRAANGIGALKHNAQIISVEDCRKSYQQQMETVTDAIFLSTDLQAAV